MKRLLIVLALLAMVAGGLWAAFAFAEGDEPNPKPTQCPTNSAGFYEPSPYCDLPMGPV